jgi:hypothetical protein
MPAKQTNADNRFVADAGRKPRVPTTQLRAQLLRLTQVLRSSL